MPKIVLGAHYELETFQHIMPHNGGLITDTRQRPRGVLALIGDGMGGIPTVNPPALKMIQDHTGDNNSLSLYSPALQAFDSRDFFLQAYDGGHLIGDSLGGTEAPYNLAPMASRLNRGGRWKSMETKINSHKSVSLLFIRVEYSPNDPRIPSSFKSRAILVDKNSAGEAELAWKDVAPRFGDVFNLSDASVDFPVPSTNSVYPITGKSIVVGSFDQGWDYCPAPLCDVNLEALSRLVMDTMASGEYMEWCRKGIENSGFLLAPWTDGQFASEVFRLPVGPQGEINDLVRPYQVLDYLAMRKKLDSVVSNPTVRKSAYTFDLGQNYLKMTFPDHYRSLVLAMNRIIGFCQGYSTDRERAEAASKLTTYLSDVKEDSAGFGRMTTNPQVDHIIPVRPDDGKQRGPTIFSNAFLTSSMYNGSKGNSIIFNNITVMRI